jgi:riboflavin synthase
MFTGLVQDTARVVSYAKDPSSDCWNLWVETRLPTKQWKLGDSIANNGVCLTIVKIQADEIQAAGENKATRILFQVGPETLKVTNFENLKEGQGVHLESSLRAGDPLGGHWVSGHVDSCAILKDIQQGQEVLTLCFELEKKTAAQVAPFLVKKGSIAVDGVSLTVNEVRDTADGSTEFEVTLIPHTLQLTRFEQLKKGDRVNLEADLIAKHAARYAEYWRTHS